MLRLDQPLARVSRLLVLILVGLIAAAAATQVQAVSKRTLVVLLGSLGLIALIAFTRQPRAVLLVLWIIALPYSRMYFSFESVVGHAGSQGLYWIPSDPFLAALLGLWVYELVTHKRPVVTRGRPLGAWFAPFVAACLLSMLAAARMDWAAFEMVRVLKAGLIVYYIRRNVGRTEWWVCVGALGLSVGLQTFLAGAQVATRSPAGVFSVLGLGDASAQSEAAAAAELYGGWMRTTGSTSHPTNLACYLLIPIPFFAGLALTGESRRARAVCAAIAGAGLLTLASTLTRWPCAIALAQLAVLAGVLAGFREVRAKAMLGGALVGLLVVAVASLPMADRLYQRLTGDVHESIEFRERYYPMTWARISDNPLVGIGLNNFAYDILKWDPELEFGIDNAETTRQALKIRLFVTPHQLFLLVLAETGFLGLFTFLLLIAGILWQGALAIASTRGCWRAAATGLVLGLAGTLGTGLTDFTLWVDPNLYTFAIGVGLMNVIPTLATETA